VLQPKSDFKYTIQILICNNYKNLQIIFHCVLHTGDDLAEREQVVRIIALIGESKIARPVLVNILYFRKLWTELGKPPIK